MTANDQLDTILGSWFDEGPMDLPDVTRRAILTAIPTTSQARRGLFAPGRFSPMPSNLRVAAVIAISVIAIGGAALLFGTRNPSGPGGLEPTPTSTVGPTRAPAPTPVQGRAATFVIPFDYTLPAGSGLEVDESNPILHQFRHPSPSGQGFDSGIVVRAISGGRIDPCDETSATLPMADQNAFRDYLRTVPTLEVVSEGTGIISHLPAASSHIRWAEPTANCPNVWLWPEEGSITDLGGRTPSWLSVVHVAGELVVFNAFGPGEGPGEGYTRWVVTADQFLSSIRFDPPRGAGSPEP